MLSLAVWLNVLFLGACGPSSLPSPAAESSPPAAESPPPVTAATPAPPELTAAELYDRLDLRSLATSMAQQLKVECGRHPRDFFPHTSASFEGDRKVTLTKADRVWVLEVVGPDRFEMTDQITDGTYLTHEEITVRFDEEAAAWRADQTSIPEPDGC